MTPKPARATARDYAALFFAIPCVAAILFIVLTVADVIHVRMATPPAVLGEVQR